MSKCRTGEVTEVPFQLTRLSLRHPTGEFLDVPNSTSFKTVLGLTYMQTKICLLKDLENIFVPWNVMVFHTRVQVPRPLPRRDWQDHAWRRSGKLCASQTSKIPS